VETDRDVEDFLENHLEGVCFAEFCNASCNDLTQPDQRMGIASPLNFPLEAMGLARGGG
jgi:hypothetical protein